MKLGPYEVLAPLGAGGMGEVWRARDPRVDRSVALKVLPEEFFESDEGRKGSRGGANLLASLNHPGIATLHVFEEIPLFPSSSSGARHILVMELLQGETLRERLRGGALPLRTGRGLCGPDARGPGGGAREGDRPSRPEPQNVFLTKDDRVKVFDFGLAKLLGEKSRRREPRRIGPDRVGAGVFFGTVGFMSPEQVRGEPWTTARTSSASARSSTRCSRERTRSARQRRPRHDGDPEGGAAASGGPLARPFPHRHPLPREKARREVSVDAGLISGSRARGPHVRSRRGVADLPAPALAHRRLLVAAAVLLALAGGYLIGTRTKRTETPAFKRLTFRAAAW